MLIYERSVASNQASIMERAPGSMLDTTMRLLMRKNSVYIAFIFTGAIIGERVGHGCPCPGRILVDDVHVGEAA